MELFVRTRVLCVPGKRVALTNTTTQQHNNTTTQQQRQHKSLWRQHLTSPYVAHTSTSTVPVAQLLFVLYIRQHKYLWSQHLTSPYVAHTSTSTVPVAQLLFVIHTSAQVSLIHHFTSYIYKAWVSRIRLCCTSLSCLVHLNMIRPFKECFFTFS